MSVDLAIYNPGVLAEKVEYCRLLADSGLLPDVYRQRPANVLYAVEYGESIGVPAMAAITGIHVIKGKPSASAALVGALVRKAGHKLRVRGNDQTARAVIIRADDPEFEYVSEWTLERAVTAGLCELRNGKPYARDDKGRPTSWERYPAAMLKARAVTEVARDACEEVLFGLHYTPEELGADVDEDGVPTTVTVSQPAESAPVEAPQQQPAEHVEDAEVVPEPEQPRMITDGQCKAVHTLLSVKRGKLTDEAKHAGFSKFAGREITSTKQLTAIEASNLIDALSKLEDCKPEAPPARPRQAADDDENFHQADALMRLEEQQADPRVELEQDLRDAIESAGDYADLNTVMLTAAAARDDGRLTIEQYTRLSAAADQRAAGARQMAGAAS